MVGGNFTKLNASFPGREYTLCGRPRFSREVGKPPLYIYGNPTVFAAIRAPACGVLCTFTLLCLIYRALIALLKNWVERAKASQRNALLSLNLKVVCSISSEVQNKQRPRLRDFISSIWERNGEADATFPGIYFPLYRRQEDK